MTSKLASLHAGLVVRKGEATPAVLNPSMTYVDAPIPMPQRHDPGIAQRAFPLAKVRQSLREIIPSANQSPPAPVREPAPEPVKVDPTPTPRAPKRSAPTPDTEHPGPYQLTFRMTADQRRRLRIASAQKDTSLQHLMSEALDKYIDGLCACSLKECACLAREQDHKH